MQLPFNTPLGFIGFLMLALGVFLLLAGFNILNVERITVKPGMSTWSVGMMFAAMGVILVFLADQRTGIGTISTPAPLPTPTSQVNAGIAAAATSTAAPTTIPTVLSETPVQEPSSPKLFSRNCFPSTTWLVSPGTGGAPLAKSGCWQMSAWGWAAAENGLSIYIKESKATDTVGIYTSVDPYVQITFDLRINRLYSLGNAAARVYFGVVDLNEPDKGSFFIVKETSDEFQAELQVGENLKYPTSLGSYFRYGRPSTIDLVLEGPKISVYLNGQLLSEQGITISEPAFWIGNRFNLGGDVDLNISNLVIAAQ